MKNGLCKCRKNTRNWSEIRAAGNPKHLHLSEDTTPAASAGPSHGLTGICAAAFSSQHRAAASSGSTTLPARAAASAPPRPVPRRGVWIGLHPNKHTPWHSTGGAWKPRSCWIHGFPGASLLDPRCCLGLMDCQAWWSLAEGSQSCLADPISQTPSLGFVLGLCFTGRVSQEGSESPASHQGFTSHAWPASLAAPNQLQGHSAVCGEPEHEGQLLQTKKNLSSLQQELARGTSLSQFMGEGMSIGQIQSALTAGEDAQWFGFGYAMHSLVVAQMSAHWGVLSTY